MEFKDFNAQVQKQFAIMCQTGKLFRADISGSAIWDLYLASFENEQIFRDPESSKHNCNACKNFIRRYGNIVSVTEDSNIETLFTNVINVGEYSNSANTIDLLIKSKEIKDVFFETYNELNNNLNYESCKKNQDSFKLGTVVNLKQYTQEEADKFGVVNTEKVYEFEHFNIDVPKQFVDKTGDSVERIMARYRDKYNVFKRTMEEISLDTLHLVRDLINQGSLLDGTAHLHAVENMIKESSKYQLCSTSKTIDNWFWVTTYDMSEAVAKFKNTLIGVLCSELSEGLELNDACKNWNKRVDPINYHKTAAPVTESMKKNAVKDFIALGYSESSITRRLATIEDIKASEILHLNSGDGKIKEISVFDNVKTTPTQHKRSKFDDVEEVSIEKFMSDILPNCTNIEAFLKNSHSGNLVALTTTKNQDDSKILFKWDNNYSWTFNGNLAGKSQIKQAVKDAGGNVDGVLNFRLAWNDIDTKDSSDLDAWCIESNGTRIGYSTGYRADKQGKPRTRMTGQLDVDNTSPNDKIAVENITWIDQSKMQDGVYKFWVNQFSARNSQGFKAEIEFDGEIYSYNYNRPLGSKVNIQVAEVTLKDGEFTINHKLPETNSSKELWGIETNNFHRVNLVCLSPNHWGENQVGNKHYMFMLDKCKTDTSIRGFHNENLNTELLKHRKFMEVLGATNMIEPSGKYLAGLGFNSTVKDELIVKCSGSFKRIIKIKF